ncbi:MAG: cell division protein FtsX [Weeksellaceae bacterium]
MLKSLRRTPYQTFAAGSVLFFTLLLAGVLFLSLTFLQGLLQYVETRPRIIVYFQIEAEEEEIFAVRDALQDTGKTADVKYVSKDEAFKIYKEFAKNDPLLVEMTSPDILPASLEVDSKEPRFLPEIADFLKTQPGVDEVQFQKDIFNNLLSLTNNLRKISIIFFSYLLFMSIIVLVTTTSFKIALKKDEIELQKLLGGSNFYIRKPFIFESMFLGFMASLAANAVLLGLMFSLNSFLQNYFSDISGLQLSLGFMSLQVWPFNPFFIIATILFTTLFSLIITLTASINATNRYL